MKEHYTLRLTGHQAINSALLLARKVVALPPCQSLQNVPTEGIEAALVKDEFDLIHKQVVRQFEEQDHQ